MRKAFSLYCSALACVLVPCALFAAPLSNGDFEVYDDVTPGLGPGEIDLLGNGVVNDGCAGCVLGPFAQTLPDPSWQLHGRGGIYTVGAGTPLGGGTIVAPTNPANANPAGQFGLVHNNPSSLETAPKALSISQLQTSVNNYVSDLSVATTAGYTLDIQAELDALPGTATVHSGSVLTTVFSAAAGDTLQFVYDFLTDEPQNSTTQSDFSFIMIDNLVLDESGGDAEFPESDKLGDVFDALASSSSGYARETGWQSYMSDPLNGVTNVTYDYLLVVGVVHEYSTGQDTEPSALAVDSFETTSSSESSASPEPSAVVLLVLGLVGLLGRGRRKRSRA